MRVFAWMVFAWLIAIGVFSACASAGEPLFGLAASIAAFCALLKLAEKVGWA